MSTAGGEIVVYEAPDGEIRVDVRLEQETVWLTQRQTADLFDTTPENENTVIHLKNIFEDNESEDTATAKDFLAVQTEATAKYAAT